MSIPSPESLLGTPPAAPPLPHLPPAESVLGQIPGVSVGKRGAVPHLPRFARGRPPRPFASNQRPAPAPAAPAAPTVVNVQAAPAPAAVPARAPGTEVPHDLGAAAPTQPSAADRLRRVLSRMNPSQRESVRDMAARQRGKTPSASAIGEAERKRQAGEPLTDSDKEALLARQREVLANKHADARAYDERQHANQPPEAT